MSEEQVTENSELTARQEYLFNEFGLLGGDIYASALLREGFDKAAVVRKVSIGFNKLLAVLEELHDNDVGLVVDRTYIDEIRKVISANYAKFENSPEAAPAEEAANG